MKKFKTLAILLAGILVLSACNSNTGDTDKEPSDSGSGSQQQEETTDGDKDKPADEMKNVDEATGYEWPALPKGDGSEIIVWNRPFEEWNQKHFEEKVEQFNQADRGYTVKQEFVSDATWGEQMVAAQATKTAPDVYLASYNHLWGAVDDETILPLNDIFAQSQLDDISDNVREMISFNDKVYAYPQLVEPSTVLFYRTDKFAEAGIDKAPTTWAELIEAAEKLKPLTDNNSFALGIAGFGVDMAWGTWGWQLGAAGHWPIEDSWAKPAVDDSYKELALFWKELYDKQLVPEQALSAYNDITPYGEEGLFMAFSGSWGIAQLINDYPEVWENTAIAVPPTKDGSTDSTISTNGGWVYVIDALTQKVDGAYNYISWLLAEDPARPAEFFEIAQYSKSPTRKSVHDYIDKAVDAPDHSGVVAEIAGRAVAEPNYPFSISQEVATLFEKVALLGTDADEAVKEANDAIAEIIELEQLEGKNPRN